jgi:hypothetical protein
MTDYVEMASELIVIFERKATETAGSTGRDRIATTAILRRRGWQPR